MAASVNLSAALATLSILATKDLMEMMLSCGVCYSSEMTLSAVQQGVAAPVDVVPIQRCQKAKSLTVFVNKVDVLIAHF